MATANSKLVWMAEDEEGDVPRWFPCDHGAATHSCIMHDTGRGTLCKNAARYTDYDKTVTHCKINC